jgi:hypothetical protein
MPPLIITVALFGSRFDRVRPTLPNTVSVSDNAALTAPFTSSLVCA